MITDLEPDILVCEVKWALENVTKTKLVDRAPVHTFLPGGMPAVSKPHLALPLFLGAKSSDITALGQLEGAGA